jgi:alcohol dehydrogenase (cytochrome c)
VWNRQVTDPQTEALTGQPYAIKDMVYVANSNGDWGTRGWAEAMDSRTGEQVWRFYFVPAPGEPGNETWGGDSWKSGGAAAWTAPSYDPELNFLYWGTSNASPAYDAEFRPGDNLYTASTVVLNADTGELEWFFQYQANEALELDEINQRALVDVEIGGVMRKVMAHQSTRNGHFYVLDRVNGDFMSATRQYEGPKLWTAGIDPKTGHPIEYDPNLAIQTYGGHQPNRSDWSEPFCQSRTSWGGQAYHPGLGRVYSEVSPSCTNARKTIPPAWHAGVGLEDFGYVIGGVVDGVFYGHTVAAEYLGGSRAAPAEMTSQLPAGAVTATDVATGEVVARGADRLYNNPDGGILATAGGLVFTGHQDGTVIAYDARTMATLWSINVGTTFGAPPIAYAVSGKQYIAINGGRAGSGDLAAHRAAPMLWVFSL